MAVATATHEQTSYDPSTNSYLVAKMCDLSEPLVSDPNKKFFEPGCGDGNFLAEVFRRRLCRIDSSAIGMLIAISNIYGLDLSKEKIYQARHRLYKLAQAYTTEHSISYDYYFWPVFANIIEHNVISADFLADWTSIKLVDWERSDVQVFRPKTVSLQELADSAGSNHA